MAQERYTNYKNQPLQFTFPTHFTGKLPVTLSGVEGLARRPKAAIIREKGVNGDREMAYALYLAGFDVLQSEIAELTAEPTGAGLDVPEWLAAVEDEVDIVNHGGNGPGSADEAPVPRLKLSYEAIAENAQRMAVE